MTKGLVTLAALLFSALPVFAVSKEISEHLQSVSVTIKANGAQGSGVMTRVGDTNYVWTAAHVVDGLMHTREVISDGGKKTVVEFDDAEVVKDLVDKGRKVGEIKFLAEVIRFSAWEQEDLAVLRVRKKELMDKKVVFFLDSEIPTIGTELCHVGSLLGQLGSNSFTTGVYSQVGRLQSGIIFDQTTCAAFPGSSGGGVFLEDGRYVGMITRGAGETFNLIVPIRRMKAWADKVGVGFTLDPSLKIPTDAEINGRPVIDNGSNFKSDKSDGKEFKKLVYIK